MNRRISGITITCNSQHAMLSLSVKSGAIIFSLGIFLIGCTPSFHIPTIEESEKKITEITPRLDSIKNEISSRISLPKGNDIVTRIRISTINSMLKTFARASKNYLNCEFLQKEIFISHEDSIRGLYYLRSINIDSGNVDLDLKTFQFTTVSNDTLRANIIIKDTGSIYVTYVFNTFRSNNRTQFEFSLNEQVQFFFSIPNSKKILLCPVPKTIMLKTKFRTMPIEALDFFHPINIPAPLQSEIFFLLPAVSYGDRRPNYMTRSLTFTCPTISADNNIIEYKSDLSIIKQ